VAPTSLYLAVLRSRDRPLALVIFPAAMMLGLLALAPVLGARMGLAGIALAWVASTVPVGAYAAWQLHRETSGVTHLGRALALARPPNLE
jgi:hypothetical protein